MQKYSPLVSINITTYNRAHLLPRSIDSVLRQTYKNMEIIIVDDHSTDHTKKVVKKYLVNDKRVKYIYHKRNLGLSHSRNTALKASSGKYIAFMDDDDEWIDKNKIRKQVQIFETDKSNRLGIICSCVNIIRNKKTFQKILRKPKNLIKHMLQKNSLIYSPTVLIRRESLRETGVFDIKLKRDIDSDLYRSFIIKHNYDIYIMPDITTNIDETASNRITPLKNIRSLARHIYTDMRTLKKYFSAFLRYPSILLHRMGSITKAAIEIFILGISIILNIIKR
jgi:glycosyltransferase involved in cell wall biosynthesis